MSWDAKDVALLKELWAAGYSAGQIASRLGYSRNAVSAKLKRLGHKRGHKPPTANPRIVAVPTRKPALGGSLRPAGGSGWCLRGSRSRSRPRNSPRNSPSVSFTPCWPMRSGIRADACCRSGREDRYDRSAPDRSVSGQACSLPAMGGKCGLEPVTWSSLSRVSRSSRPWQF